MRGLGNSGPKIIEFVSVDNLGDNQRADPVENSKIG